MEASWAVLEASWGPLVLSSVILRPYWAFLEASWANLEASWTLSGRLGGHLGPPWANLGAVLEAIFGHLGHTGRGKTFATGSSGWLAAWTEAPEGILLEKNQNQALRRLARQAPLWQANSEMGSEAGCVSISSRRRSGSQPAGGLCDRPSPRDVTRHTDRVW